MSGTRNLDGPLISVIIPAYNAERFVEEAIVSAQRQTYSNIEIIVADDGSADRTLPIVRRIAAEDSRVRLLSQANQGVASARNRAILSSEGEFVAPLDADDVWFPEKLERQLRRLQEAGPSAGLVYSWWMYMNNDSELYGLAGRPDSEGRVFREHIIENFIGNASVPLFRRSSLDRVGLYDVSLREQGAEGCEDWDLTLRVAEQYEVCLVPTHLSAYRTERHRTADRRHSMSDNTDSMVLSYEAVIGRIRQEHPYLPEKIFQYSAANFYDYLLHKSYESGRFMDTLYWIFRLVRIDAAALLSPWIWGKAIKSAVKEVCRPLASALALDSERWENIKCWVQRPYNKIRESRQRRFLEGTATPLPRPDKQRRRPGRFAEVDPVS